MDYADESYVRLYTRDTKTWLRLGFEGQTVLMFLFRKLDRSGVLDGMDEPVDDLALMTGVPLEIVRVGLPRLLQWDVAQLVGNRLVVPHFVEAQSARRTDGARQRASRDRRNADGSFAGNPADPSHAVTRGHTRSHDPALGHEPSHAVTRGHTPSQPVTLSLALPSSAKPSQAALPDPERAQGPVLPPLPPGADTRPPTWVSYPVGWRWSAETEAAAAIAAVSTSELQEQVKYWTIHTWRVPVRDLDGELQRSFGAIRTRSETARAQAQAPPYARRGRGPPVLAQPNCGMTGLEQACNRQPKPAELPS